MYVRIPQICPHQNKKKKSEIHSGVLPDMKKPINVYVILVVKLIYIYI